MWLHVHDSPRCWRCAPLRRAPAPLTEKFAAAGPAIVHAQDQVVVHVPKEHGSIGVVVLHSYGHGPAEARSPRMECSGGPLRIRRDLPEPRAGLERRAVLGVAMKVNRDDVGWLPMRYVAAQARYP